MRVSGSVHAFDQLEFALPRSFEARKRIRSFYVLSNIRRKTNLGERIGCCKVSLGEKGEERIYDILVGRDVWLHDKSSEGCGSCSPTFRVKDDVGTDIYYYAARIELERPKIARSLVVKGNGKVPWNIHSVVVVYEDGEVEALSGLQGIGFQKMNSKDPAKWEYFKWKGTKGWAWVVPEARPIRERESTGILSMLRDPSWHPESVVWVETDDFGTVLSANAIDSRRFRGEVSIAHEQPEKWLLRTRTNDRGWLILSVTWYPGWRAQFDGRPVKKIYRAYGSRIAIPVDEGEHLIEFSYETPFFSHGAAGSFLSLALCVFGLTGGAVGCSKVAFRGWRIGTESGIFERGGKKM